MSNQTCYKIVVNRGGILESITPIEKGGLIYTPERFVKPETGPAFAFRTLDAAVEFWHARRAEYESSSEEYERDMRWWPQYIHRYVKPIFSDELWEAEGQNEIPMRFMIWPGYKLNARLIEWFWKTNAHQYLPMDTESRGWIYQGNPLDQTIGFESVNLTRKLEDWEVYEKLRELRLLDGKSGGMRRLYDYDPRKRK